MLTLRHSVSYRNYSPGRIFQIDGIPWTSCVDRSCFNLPSELPGVFAGWSRHSRRGMATSLASFSSACLGKHPSARSGDSCPPNVILSGWVASFVENFKSSTETKGHHFRDLCRRLNWSLRLCPMTAQRGFPSTCQFLACKTWSWHGIDVNHFYKCSLFFCLDSVAGKLCYFCHGHGRELGKLRKLVIPRVCLCVFIRCNDLKKVGFHPSAVFHSWHLLARCCSSFSYSWSCW